MYDAYISLGHNCEAGLNFRRIGYEVSSFFRFTSSSYSSTVRLIESNFSGVYEKKNIVPVTDRMIRDRGTRVVHHSLLRSHQVVSKAADGADILGRKFNQNYDFDAVYEQEYAKVCYLIQKWRDLVASDKRVLYIFKHHRATNRALAKKLLRVLRSQHPNHRCDLLYIQLANFCEPNWPEDGLFNRYFSRFAPHNAAQQYDVAAWDQVFAEFPLNADADRGTERGRLGRKMARFEP